jgi:hypothetical protein
VLNIILRLLILIIGLAPSGLALTGCQWSQPDRKPAYGVKVTYALGQPLEFPDFTLEFLGQRKESDPKFPAGFTFFDFRLSREGQIQTVSWSSGAGDIGPTLFEFGGHSYRLERAYSDEFGWLKDDEVVIWKDD